MSPLASFCERRTSVTLYARNRSTPFVLWSRSFYGNMLSRILSQLKAFEWRYKREGLPLSTPAVIPMNCHTLIHVLGDRLLIWLSWSISFKLEGKCRYPAFIQSYCTSIRCINYGCSLLQYRFFKKDFFPRQLVEKESLSETIRN